MLDTVRRSRGLTQKATDVNTTANNEHVRHSLLSRARSLASKVGVPEYKLAKQKGYLTREHMAGMEKFSVSPIHRSTFAPLEHMTLDDNLREAVSQNYYPGYGLQLTMASLLIDH